MGSRVITQTTTDTQTSTRDIGFTGQAGVDLAAGLAAVGRATSVDAINAGIRSQEVSAAAGAGILQTIENVAIINSQDLALASQERLEGFNRLVGGAQEVFVSQAKAAEGFLKRSADVVSRLGPQTKQNQNLAIGGLVLVGLVIVVAFRRK